MMLARDSRFPDGLASHPYHVDHISDLSHDLRELAFSALPQDEKVNASFVIPFSSFADRVNAQRRYEPEQALLFTQHGILHVQASGPHKPYFQSRFLYAQDLLMMSLSRIMLYGRIELTGKMNGHLDQILVEYNPVSHHLLLPDLLAFLRESWSKSARPAIDRSVEDQVCHDLKKLPPRFQDELQNNALQPGERLLGIIFQPPILERNWLGFSRSISSPTLLALTNRQVVAIQEEKSRHSHQNGWNFTFLPLQAIHSVEIRLTGKHEIFTFLLQRSNTQSQWSVPLNRSIASDWQVIWDCYGKFLDRGGCS